jgi:hypothetical protein
VKGVVTYVPAGSIARRPQSPQLVVEEVETAGGKTPNRKTMILKERIRQ